MSNRIPSVRVRIGLIAAAIAMLCLGLAPAGALAKPGDRDRSFGIDPFAIGVIGAGAFADGLDSFADLELAPGGRVVLAGDTEVAGDNDFAVGRLRPNGKLDTSFGDAVNHVATGTIDGDDDVHDIAVSGNGSIFIAAGSANGPERFGVAKLDPGGFLDNGFSGDGRQTTGIGTNAAAQAVAVGKQGRVVVAGRATIGGDSRIAVVRYLPGGSPDPSFGGGDGIALLDGPEGTAFDLALQKDGKIVVAGATLVASATRLAVARFRANGTPDPSFGSAGLVRVKAGSEGFALSVGIDGRRRIVVAGASGIGNGAGIVARLKPSGRRDRSFGGDGVVASKFGNGSAFFSDLAVQRNGRIVVVGEAGDIPGILGATLVGRLLPNGRVDRGFADRGFRLAFLGATEFNFTAVALQGNGRILLGTSLIPDADVEALAAQRYLGDPPRR